MGRLERGQGPGGEGRGACGRLALKEADGRVEGAEALGSIPQFRFLASQGGKKIGFQVLCLVLWMPCLPCWSPHLSAWDLQRRGVECRGGMGPRPGRCPHPTRSLITFPKDGSLSSRTWAWGAPPASLSVVVLRGADPVRGGPRPPRSGPSIPSEAGGLAHRLHQ